MLPVEKTARPIHNFLIKAARTWIQGIPDFAGVLFAVLVIRAICCFPLTPRRLFALGPINWFGEIDAALKISFLAVEVCARSGVFKQPPGSGLFFDRKEAGLSIRKKISR